MHMHTVFFNWKMGTVHLILSHLWGVRPYKPASKYSYLCEFPFPQFLPCPRSITYTLYTFHYVLKRHTIKQFSC